MPISETTKQIADQMASGIKGRILKLRADKIALQSQVQAIQAEIDALKLQADALDADIPKPTLPVAP